MERRAKKKTDYYGANDSERGKEGGFASAGERQEKEEGSAYSAIVRARGEEEGCGINNASSSVVVVS